MKKKGWKSAMASPAVSTIFTGHPLKVSCPSSRAMTSRMILPMIRRMAPIDMLSTPCGRYIFAVPTVPHSIAAMRMITGAKLAFMMLPPFQQLVDVVLSEHGMNHIIDTIRHNGV